MKLDLLVQHKPLSHFRFGPNLESHSSPCPLSGFDIHPPRGTLSFISLTHPTTDFSMLIWGCWSPPSSTQPRYQFPLTNVPLKMNQPCCFLVRKPNRGNCTQECKMGNIFSLASSTFSFFPSILILYLILKTFYFILE